MVSDPGRLAPSLIMPSVPAAGGLHPVGLFDPTPDRDRAGVQISLQRCGIHACQGRSELGVFESPLPHEVGPELFAALHERPEESTIYLELQKEFQQLGLVALAGHPIPLSLRPHAKDRTPAHRSQSRSTATLFAARPQTYTRPNVAMLRAIDEMNEEVPGLDLAVRIGITTGETLVTLSAEAAGEGIVAGVVVNTAARLQEIAPVGGIVVAEGTYRGTRNLVEYEELEPVSVKGRTEPVSLWRPIRFRSRYGSDVDQLPQTPFIGRDDELEVLKRTFARALRESSVQLITIMGEPGVGKSRLVREFFAYIHSLPKSVHWRQGRCLAYGDGITYWAFGQIVKAHAGILDSDGPEVAADKLHSAVRAALGDSPDSDWVKARLGPLVGMTPLEPTGPDRSEIHTAWRRFLEAVASANPLILAFEDLHWADQPMLTFIEHLVDWSSDVPMLVLCTSRPELYERHPGWGGGKRNSTTISLAPLGLAEIGQLLSALLSEPTLSVESEAELLERAGGNPLYAEEFAQMLKDRILPGDFMFPDSLHAIIAARLDSLPPSLKGLLQEAAVVGKVFWSGALASMAGVDEKMVLDGLHELTRRELVRPARVSSMENQAEFGFWHALIADVAYGEIPRAARARKHRAVAEWMERLIGPGPSERAELLVYHYGQALE